MTGPMAGPMAGQATQPVGLIGLGIMGSAIRDHLLTAGFTVVGHDVDAARVAEHEHRGGLVASSAAEVAERAPVIVTSLPSVAAFEDVVGGSGGLVDRAYGTADPGGTGGDRGGGTGADRGGGDVGDAAPVVIETSTLPLETKLDAHRLLSGHGMHLLDCPLSGTGAQAASGDLVVYVSGDDPVAKRRAAPVLQGFARAHYDVGELGNGSKTKIVANLLVAIHNVAAAEALQLADSAGLDLERTLTAVGDGAGGSRMLDVRGPLMIAERYDEATMRVEVFQKDVDIIASFARRLHSPTPLLAASSRLYEAALHQGRGHQDTACVRAVLADLATESSGGRGDQHP